MLLEATIDPRRAKKRRRGGEGVGCLFLPSTAAAEGAGLEAHTTAGLHPHGPPRGFPPVRGDPGLETGVTPRSVDLNVDSLTKAVMTDTQKCSGC